MTHTSNAKKGVNDTLAVNNIVSYLFVFSFAEQKIACKSPIDFAIFCKLQSFCFCYKY